MCAGADNGQKYSGYRQTSDTSAPVTPVLRPVLRPVLLCILDGWGYRTELADNAIAAAQTPCWDSLMQRDDFALLDASGTAVGLPEGQMGNSEVGHMCIGAGRAIPQGLVRINAAIDSGALFAAPAFEAFVARRKARNSRAHILGLASAGGVHAAISHMAAIAAELHRRGVALAIHTITDGRDGAPMTAQADLVWWQQHLPYAPIVSVSGRYYAMDRDRNDERTQQALHAIAHAQAPRYADAAAVIAASYEQGVTDEFIPPAVVGDYDGLASGDGMIMTNFRADRARQILGALTHALGPSVDICGLGDYGDALAKTVRPLMAHAPIAGTLGAVVAEQGRTQLRIAETEKYAHVTFFFSGGREAPFPGEHRILIPSPKVATYDMCPQMAAGEIGIALADAIASKRYALIIANIANADMVGHTGNMAAAVQACQAVDGVLARVADAIERVGGVGLVSADHGNAEQMFDPGANMLHTAHTHNPVPVVTMGAAPPFRRRNGTLCDLAPTLLQAMDLPVPAHMSGTSLWD